MKTFLRYFLFATVFIIGSCDKTIGLEESDVIAVSTDNVSFDCGGGTQNVVIDSYCQWSAVCDAPWVRIKYASGDKGSVENELTVSENPGAVERTAEIVIKNEEYDIERKINVIQKPREIILSSNSLAFTDGNEQSVTVESSVPWSAICDASWVTLTKNDNILTVIVSDNSDVTSRSTVIVFKHSEKGNELGRITVTQGINAVDGGVYVDLGLPSGLLWAACNVGASKPEDAGNYYAWGETTTKGSYIINNSLTQGKEMVDISCSKNYDVAYSTLGGKWRMPTTTEFNELAYNCTMEWTVRNGVWGYSVTGSNGNNIFLPAVGWHDGILHDNAGRYWCATPSDISVGAYAFNFTKTGKNISGYDRYHGCSVRPVYGDYFSIEKNRLQVKAEAGNYSIKVNANVQWIAECDDSWVTLTKNDNILTVTVKDNYILEKRTAIISFCSPNGNIYATAEITQEATNFGLELSELYFTENASTQSVNIMSNFPWTAECNASWITLSPQGNILDVTVEQNTGRFERSATIEFRHWDTKSLLNTIEIVQGKATTGEANGHNYVDLGLPSGLLWATCNVGASSPESNGNYYAWGETATKSSYTQENSRTYGQDMVDISNNSSYDVAKAIWGGNWRMPTMNEIEELLEKCEWKRITQNGVNGWKVTGSNGNSIFLPNDGITGEKYSSQYWSSTPSDNNKAYFLSVSSLNIIGAANRYYGCCVRPVMK